MAFTNNFQRDIHNENTMRSINKSVYNFYILFFGIIIIFKSIISCKNASVWSSLGIAVVIVVVLGPISEIVFIFADSFSIHGHVCRCTVK